MRFDNYLFAVVSVERLEGQRDSDALIYIRTFQISLPALGRSRQIKSTAVASGRTFSRGHPDSTDIRKATKSFYQYRCKSLSRISLVRTVLWIYLLAQFLYLVPSARELRGQVLFLNEHGSYIAIALSDL